MALESGLHVLVEKPLTTEVEQASELVQFAKEKKLVLQVGYVERYRTKKFRESIKLESPFVIECVRHFDKPGRELDLDVVFDLMIHDLDLVSQLINEEGPQIEAWGMISPRGVIDSAWAVLNFSPGNKAVFSASRVAQKPQREIRVFSPSQSVSLDMSGAAAGERSFERSTRCFRNQNPIYAGIPRGF